MAESRPETRYAAVGDADVAYQVMGDGPPDILLFNPLGTHLELAWQVPGFDGFASRLASVQFRTTPKIRVKGLAMALEFDAEQEAERRQSLLKLRNVIE